MVVVVVVTLYTREDKIKTRRRRIKITRQVIIYPDWLFFLSFFSL